MKFSMIQNAQDSLEHAVENIVDKNRSKDGNLKRVIQELSHVVELILKERLSRAMPDSVEKLQNWESNVRIWTDGTSLWQLS